MGHKSSNCDRFQVKAENLVKHFWDYFWNPAEKNSAGDFVFLKHSKTTSVLNFATDVTISDAGDSAVFSECNYTRCM